MQELTDEHEQIRREGLRLLARLIARHYLAQQQLRPDRENHADPPSCAPLSSADGDAPGRPEHESSLR